MTATNDKQEAGMSQELKSERFLKKPHAWIMNIPKTKVCLFCKYTCPTSQRKVPECQ